jgi:carbonic anhydrase
MSAVKEELIRSNALYADKNVPDSSLPARPAKKTAILTCMDARLDPLQFAGLVPGDAHIIRNAGGRASDDAIRSLVISHKFLGTGHWFVIHHTDCGMETISGDTVADLLSDNLDEAVQDADGWRNVSSGGGSDAGRDLDWLTITDPRQSVLDDIKRIREHPLVSPEVKVYGFLLDMKTGRLEEIMD